MAKEGQDPKCENTNKVDIAALYECSKDELINVLVSFAKLEQRYSSKYKDLKRNFQEVKQKIVALEKMNNDLHDKIRILENKNEELQNKCDKEHKIILKFNDKKTRTNCYVPKEHHLTKKELDITTLTKENLQKFLC